MASQLLVDLYGCDEKLLNDLEAIRDIARQAIREIGSDIVEECVHRFEPVGITYIAVITTSHFSIHTWPEHGYAAVDIFSCQEAVPDRLAAILRTAFRTGECRVRKYEREIGGDGN